MKTRRSAVWRRRDMQWKTGAAFALLAGLMFVLVGFFSGQQARRQVTADIGGSLDQVAVRLAASLDADIFERFREIRNLADLDSLLGSPPEPARWRPVLDKLQQTFPHYAWIGVADVDGTVLAATGGVLEGRSVAERPWFRQALRQPSVGDVHDALLLSKLLPQPPGGEPLRLVDVAAPVVREGRVAAVLGAHLSLRWAEERRRFELTPIEAQRRLEVLVVNARGEPLLDVAGAPGVSLPPEAVEALERHGPAVHTWSDGQKYLSAVERSAGFRDFAGLGWQVIVRQPIETAMAPARALERQIWAIGVVGAALFGVLGWWLAGRLNAPLRELAAQADALQTQPGGALERGDEVGQLAGSLAALMRRLQQRGAELAQLNRSLEARVQERTLALEHANEHLRGFSQSVSHDLKAPIATVGIAIRQVVAQERGRLPEGSRRTLEIVAAECDRLRQLVDELLSLAQVEHQALQWSEVSMSDLARAAADRALADAGASAQAAGAIELVFGDLPSAQGDAVLLQQVWQNLLSNALKFSRKAQAPRIEIVGDAQGDELVYTVCDNGSGFDMAQADRLFGVFQRLHTQADFAGTGIGLSIVKRIVQRHGGRVWAQSVPGQRTSFHFALPRHPAAAEGGTSAVRRAAATPA